MRDDQALPLSEWPYRDGDQVELAWDPHPYGTVRYCWKGSRERTYVFVEFAGRHAPAAGSYEPRDLRPRAT